jgi:hypothetical protein
MTRFHALQIPRCARNDKIQNYWLRSWGTTLDQASMSGHHTREVCGEEQVFEPDRVLMRAWDAQDPELLTS